MKKLLFVALAVMVAPALLQAADNRVGTWKYNEAKSKFDPGPAPFKSRTVKVEAAGEGVKVSVDGVGADGKAQAYSYTANYDGKDYPITGSPLADSVAYKKIDDNTLEGTNKKGGQVVSTVSVVVAKDGKSMTVTTKGKNDKGPFTYAVVMDRQ